MFCRAIFVCEPLESKAYPSGTNDTTHMKAKGAKRVAKLIADAIPENVPELAKYLRGDETFTDIQGHWGGRCYKKHLQRMTKYRESVTASLTLTEPVTRAEFFEDGNGFVWYSRSRIS